jgi:hypothetical protein
MKWTAISKSAPSFNLKTTALLLTVFGFFLAFGVGNLKAQAITEGFDNITTLPAAGWATQNNSVPVGTTGWFQGNSTVFPSQSGAPTSYIGANFNATTGANTISLWLLTPQRTFNNGDVIKFWTRTTTGNPFPDRLQVRRSSAGASTNVGTGATGVGDFTNLLIDINPTYNTGGGSPPANYPEVWTEITLTLSGLAGPTSGRIAFRYFVEDGGPQGDNSNYIGIDTFSYTPGTVVTSDAPLDFNGDGRTDWVVIRNTGGGANGQITWFWNINNAPTPTAASAWGLASDEFISEDFDGDDKDDIAVWRPGAATVARFFILQSNGNVLRQEAFGQTGDDPSVVDDYNGDNRADLAVFRPSNGTWYYRTAANGAVTFVPWGQSGDFPVPGDFDGNGSADFAVQRGVSGAGQFWIRLSTGTVQPITTFGLSSDTVVPGDYDGDGKTDIAVVRAGGGALTWYWRPSGGGANQQVTFGASATDFPVQGDYNGDGTTDQAVWRNGVFWVRSTVGGAVSNFTLGASGDYPVANYNTH